MSVRRQPAISAACLKSTPGSADIAARWEEVPAALRAPAGALSAVSAVSAREGDRDQRDEGGDPEHARRAVPDEPLAPSSRCGGPLALLALLAQARLLVLAAGHGRLRAASNSKGSLSGLWPVASSRPGGRSI